MKTVRDKILTAAEENHWTVGANTAVVQLTKGNHHVYVELNDRGGLAAFSTEYQRMVGDDKLPRVLSTLRGEEL